MRFAVIVATCDRPERLALLLDALVKSIDVHAENDRIVVVDNGCDRLLSEAVKKLCDSCPLDVMYLTSRPRNKSLALNRGIEQGGQEWFAFTDDDTLPTEGWLKQGQRYIESSGVAIAGGRVVAVDEFGKMPGWMKPGRSGRWPRGPAIVDYEPMPVEGILGKADGVPLGSNLFVKQDLFDRYGGYDEDLWQRCGSSALGCEDAEFGMRVRAAGERIGYAARAVVCHPVYPERATLRSHLSWAWKMGRREPILFPEQGRGAAMFHIKTALLSFSKSCGCAVTGDTAAAVCELMEAAKSLGNWSGSRQWRKLSKPSNGEEE